MSTRRRSTGAGTETAMDLHTHGDVLVLEGDFDVRSTGPVRTALYGLLRREGPARVVVVDLGGVGCVDVAALRVLAVATRWGRTRGHRVVLRGCGPAVRRLLHLSRLVRCVEVDRAPRAEQVGAKADLLTA